jgi:hypothetical protein
MGEEKEKKDKKEKKEKKPASKVRCRRESKDRALR